MFCKGVRKIMNTRSRVYHVRVCGGFILLRETLKMVKIALIVHNKLMP